MAIKKVFDEKIIESYKRLSNVWLVAKEVGLCGQSVHERCVKLGIIPIIKYQVWQIDFLKRNYQYYANRFKLDEMSELLIIDKPNLVRLAKKYGVKTDYNRVLLNAKTKKELYSVYMTMVARCENTKSKGFVNYGSRGIKNEFTSLDNFIEVMLPTYKKGLTLERKEVNGNYSASNCTWATPKEQSNNKRNTIYIFLDGNKVKLNEECERRGLKYDTIHKRIFKYNWDISKALNHPVLFR